MYTKKSYTIGLVIALQTIAGTAWATQGSSQITEFLEKITIAKNPADDIPQNDAERRRSSEASRSIVITFGNQAPEPRNAAEARRSGGKY